MPCRHRYSWLHAIAIGMTNLGPQWINTAATAASAGIRAVGNHRDRADTFRHVLRASNPRPLKI